MAKRIVCIFLFSFCFLTAGCESKPHVEWQSYSPEKMAEARSGGTPVIAYFYAAWCGPCMQLKYNTFSDPNVIQALKPLARLKVDMSFTHSEKVQEIAHLFHVSSLPTIIFFDSLGNEVSRVRGFFPAGDFLNYFEGIAKRLQPEVEVPVSQVQNI